MLQICSNISAYMTSVGISDRGKYVRNAAFYILGLLPGYIKQLYNF